MSKAKFIRGFTLIEVVITLGVFSIASLMAVNLFVIFVQQQRRTVAQQELQNDVRAVIEQIAQDVREGQVDYTFYSAEFPLDSEKTKLFSALNGIDNNSTGGGFEYLSVQNSFNEQIKYRLNGGAIERWKESVKKWETLTAAEQEVGWEILTPSSLEINSFAFSISPSENPFGAKDYIKCGKDDSGTPSNPVFSENLCRWGTVCRNPNTAGSCQFSRGLESDGVTKTCYCYPQTFSDVAPLHPHVTYSIHAKRTVSQQEVSQTFQTTVASRIYKSVEQLNDYAP